MNEGNSANEMLNSVSSCVGKYIKIPHVEAPPDLAPLPCSSCAPQSFEIYSAFWRTCSSGAHSLTANVVYNWWRTCERIQQRLWSTFPEDVSFVYDMHFRE